MLLRDDKDHAEARERLDEALVARNAPLRETWGQLPSQQAAMRRAAYMGGQGG